MERHTRLFGVSKKMKAMSTRSKPLQTISVRRWEGIQQGVPVIPHDQKYAPNPFTKLLCRARY